MKKLIFVYAVLLIAISTAFIGKENDKKATPGDTKTLVVEEKAPDFEVTTVTGKEVSSEKARKENKPLVVYFTASWCPMCAKNWPALSKVYPDYKDKLHFVAISIDPTDDAEVMKKLAKEKGLTFPVAAGNPKVMMAFGVQSQATTVGVDKNGNIAFRKNKEVLSEADFRELFDSLVEN